MTNVDRTIHFLREHMWRIPFHELPKRRRIPLRLLRVLVLSFRGFVKDRIQVHASALTYFTLLSIVPVLALAFSVAKAFGLRAALQRELVQRTPGQEEVLSQIITLAERAASETTGGVLAAVGVLVLVWAALRLLGSVEAAFNSIWGVKQGRPISRRFFDYLTLVLMAPILVTTAGWFTATIAGATARVSERFSYVPASGLLETWVGSFLPYLMVSLFLTLLYRLLPNTRVSLRASLFAGFVSGAIYQLTQVGYLKFQVLMTGYNATYGTFAALPLFLIWVQLSWLVVLFGAEISFAIDNEESYALEQLNIRVNQRLRRLLGIRITQIVARRFHAGQEPARVADIASVLNVPIRLAREIVYELVDAGVLIEIRGGPDETAKIQPARTIAALTIGTVLSALDCLGDSELPRGLDEEAQKIRSALDEMDARYEESPCDVPLHEL